MRPEVHSFEVPSKLEDKDSNDDAVVVRLTEHGYDIVLYNEVPHAPFIQPRAIDELRARAWLRESDIVVATYPKCGTTWMQVNHTEHA
jgi:hypothetical protein